MNFKRVKKYFLEIIFRIFMVCLPIVILGFIRLGVPCFFYQNKKWLMAAAIIIQFFWLIAYSAVVMASLAEQREQKLKEK
ncbi:MAG: hypothetical protein N2692_01755 [Patescibacteria group bacterium]|jgi:ABC-type multidrug transport system fused ATPase/permease subunit|nr:hypothetical protein [Patescibacteria group bacterium]